jgi:hypothetical protein
LQYGGQALYCYLQAKEAAVKNQFCLTIIILFFATVLVTCKDDEEYISPPPPPERAALDQPLVGGKWYEIKIADGMKYDLIYNHTDGSHSSFSADCYYEFSKIGDKFYFSSDSQRINDIYQSGELDGDTEVYSKDGIVYWKHNDKKLMAYEFHSQFPWPDSQWLLLFLERPVFNAVAANGGLITYLLYEFDVPYDTNTGINGWRYLVRARNLELN